MHSFRSRNILFPSLFHVAVLIFHQNCVSSPSLAEAFNGLVWDKNSGEFVKILSIESDARIEREFALISGELETHDFRGATLRMTAFAIRGLIEFETNEFNETVATGIHGEMWQILARMSNFKLLAIESKETEFGRRNETTGDWSGLLGSIYRNETDIIPRCLVTTNQSSAMDFTLTTWRIKYTYYMKEKFRPQKAWMVSLFSRGLWFSILVLFFALVLASYTIHVYSFEYNKKASDSLTDFTDHLLYMFSIFCVQGWLPNTLDKHSKILLLSTRLWAWLLFMAFGAKLISHLSSHSSAEPFSDIQSFSRDTNYKIIIKRNSFLTSVFVRPNWPPAYLLYKSGRIMEANNTQIEDLMCMGDHAYLEAEDVGGMVGFNKCRYIAVTQTSDASSIASGLVHGFKYKKTINLGILKLRQYGIIDHLKIKWLGGKSKKSKTSRDSLEFIKMENVVLIFAVLLFGIISSIAITIVENVTFVYRNLGNHERDSLYRMKNDGEWNMNATTDPPVHRLTARRW